MRFELNIFRVKAKYVEDVIVGFVTAPNGVNNGEREFSLRQILTVTLCVCHLLLVSDQVLLPRGIAAYLVRYEVFVVVTDLKQEAKAVHEREYVDRARGEALKESGRQAEQSPCLLGYHVEILAFCGHGKSVPPKHLHTLAPM